MAETEVLKLSCAWGRYVVQNKSGTIFFIVTKRSNINKENKIE